LPLPSSSSSTARRRNSGGCGRGISKPFPRPQPQRYVSGKPGELHPAANGLRCAAVRRPSGPQSGWVDERRAAKP
jgi:hypothetical protein